MEKLEPSSSPANARIGTGRATFCGEGSPLTQVPWLAHQVDFDPSELDEVEEFYRGRATNWEYIVSPFSAPALLPAVIQRGWTEVQYENVMGLNLEGRAAGLVRSDGTDVRLVEESQKATWSDIAMRGFFGAEIPPACANICDIIARTDDTVAFLAYLDGQRAGAATLSVYEDTCYLGGAATLPEYRGRGAQTALLDARLNHAAKMGCDLALCECVPGSQSQRNQERAGFQVLFTKIVLTRPT